MGVKVSGENNEVEIQVLTGAGNFPSSGFKKYNTHQTLQHVLDEAKEHLPLENTNTWVARLGDRELILVNTIEANQIPSPSRIAWGPVERGGGKF
jgi:hypothetical protein